MGGNAVERKHMLCRIPSGRWGLYIVMMCTCVTVVALAARCVVV